MHQRWVGCGLWPRVLGLPTHLLVLKGAEACLQLLRLLLVGCQLPPQLAVLSVSGVAGHGERRRVFRCVWGGGAAVSQVCHSQQLHLPAATQGA